MSKFCEKCYFWRYLRETEPHVGIGECHRYAPVATPKIVPNSQRAGWLLTMFDDWCGEHQPTNPTQKGD